MIHFRHLFHAWHDIAVALPPLNVSMLCRFNTWLTQTQLLAHVQSASAKMAADL